MTTIADLTKDEWTTSAHADDSGTGIIWLQGQNDLYEQIFVPDVTLARLREVIQAMQVMDVWTPDAYRWVPKTIESAASLVVSECGGRCNPTLECVNPACRCIKSRCRRK
jgi:hypothetical protein